MSEQTEDKIPMERVRLLIDQPIDGLLYDLNMLPEVLSTLDKKNSKEWLLMKVIKALKEENEAVEDLKEALIDSKEAIESLPKDCMGKGTDMHGEYPIRDEVLHVIKEALKKAGANLNEKAE